MKKFTLLLTALLMVSFSALAQIKLVVYQEGGARSEFIASSVDSIIFVGLEDTPDVPVKPDTPVVPGTGSFVAKPFSVSATKTVTFSPGNLQYHAANNEWRFAPNQTDYIGYDNENISSTYNGWIDLFAWGTGNNPTNKSTDYNDYQTFVDWGVNKIGNDAPNTWRTLTYDEWYYLRYQRPNYDKLIGVARVNGVNGLILLPDTWQCPSGVTFKSGFHSSYGEEYYATYQSFSASEWSKLEASGAVFLPAAGYRYGSDVGYVQDYGFCWAATEYNSKYAGGLYFDSDDAIMDDSGRFYGHSVRLVQDDAEADKPITYTISFDANGGSGDMQSSELEENTTFTIPSNTFTHEGYEFTGWNTKADGTGTLYAVGAEINITSDITLYAQWEEKIYDGSFVAKPFSVSATKTITFSPGNLQYHAANDEWRFAPSQTDYIGADNANISSTYNGWIDLFCWGTGNNPTNNSTDYNDYPTFVDWGVNKIGNYAPNTWRTLTCSEWYYLRYERPNYNKLIGVAQVNGVNGLIILPDGWTCPSGVTFKSGFHNNYGTQYYAKYQTFSASEWSKLEASGAVFFPAAGGRLGSNVFDVLYDGNYWSANEYSYYDADGLGFNSDEADMIYNYNRYFGLSVRLVQD